MAALPSERARIVRTNEIVPIFAGFLAQDTMYPELQTGATRVATVEVRVGKKVHSKITVDPVLAVFDGVAIPRPFARRTLLSALREARRFRASHNAAIEGK
jgi:hypothetical protein